MDHLEPLETVDQAQLNSIQQRGSARSISSCVDERGGGYYGAWLVWVPAPAKSLDSALPLMELPHSALPPAELPPEKIRVPVFAPRQVLQEHRPATLRLRRRPCVSSFSLLYQRSFSPSLPSSFDRRSPLSSSPSKLPSTGSLTRGAPAIAISTRAV
jgi:hypothetical protein